MIRVKISKTETKFNFIEVKGHANQAPYGSDIVCAGVSAVIIGGLNNLENKDSFHIEIKEGYSLIKSINDVSVHDAIVIETIISGLKSIEEEYNDFITIKAE